MVQPRRSDHEIRIALLVGSLSLAGEALEAVRLEDLRLLILEERAGSLVLAETGTRRLVNGTGVGAVLLDGVLRAHALRGSGSLVVWRTVRTAIEAIR